MSSARDPGAEVIAVEVPGGALAVEVVTSGTEPVLAVQGSSSISRHAADLVAVLDRLGVDHAASIMSLAGARATAGLIMEAMP